MFSLSISSDWKVSIDIIKWTEFRYITILNTNEFRNMGTTLITAKAYQRRVFVQWDMKNHYHIHYKTSLHLYISFSFPLKMVKLLKWEPTPKAKWSKALLLNERCLSNRFKSEEVHFQIEKSDMELSISSTIYI